MKCQNCGVQMSCGCQKKTASDGKSVCANCIGSYEISLESKKHNTQTNVNNPEIARMRQETKPEIIGINVNLGNI